MRPASNVALRTSTALLLAYALLILCAPRAGAQSTDSTHWSLFAGQTTSPALGADRSFGFPSENFGVGGSVEFKSRLFPVPLRATLSYDKFRGGPSTTFKTTSLMVDAVFRPVPAVMGIRPYLLGGFGIATQSPSGRQVMVGDLPVFEPVDRHTSLLADVGVGLEFRRFFGEYRRSPFAVAGRVPMMSRISVGMRF